MKNKKEKSIGSIISDVVFVLVFVFFIFSIFFFKFKYIQTGSMKPTMQVGSIAVINPHSKVKVWDIAMYEKGSNFVIHRIKDIEDGKYVFQGDNVSTEDLELIEEDRVVGPVVCKINFVAPLIRTIYHLKE